MKKKNNTVKIVVIVCVVVVLLFALFVGLVGRMLLRSSVQTVAGPQVYTLTGADMTVEIPAEPYVGVVPIYGEIEPQYTTGVFDEPQSYQHTALLEYIDMMMYDTNNAGLFLDIDSPGGYTYEGTELYQKLMEYKEYTGRPIWAYMNHQAASAAYMASVTADMIWANQGTTTGSIGVIISGYDMTGLYEKLGIEYISIASGENKDSSSLSDEQKEIYQVIVDEDFGRFVDAVAEGRSMSEAEVRALADGRIYSAQQAEENGLIDNVGSVDDAFSDMETVVGEVVWCQPEIRESGWASFFSKAGSILPKSDTQVLEELSEKYESGVSMMIAE